MISEAVLMELIKQRIKKHLAQIKEDDPHAKPSEHLLGIAIKEDRWFAKQLNITTKEIKKMEYEEERENIARQLTEYHLEKKGTIHIKPIYDERMRYYLQYDLETLKQMLEEIK